MVNHYLLIIYRNFLRAKSYFIINVAGLATGLACTLLIYLWVRDEYRMDKFHELDARLYSVMEHQQYADEIMTTSSTPGILAENLKIEMPEVEFAATTSWVSPYTLTVGDRNLKAKGFHVGKDFFSIFSCSAKEAMRTILRQRSKTTSKEKIRNRIPYFSFSSFPRNISMETSTMASSLGDASSMCACSL